MNDMSWEKLFKEFEVANPKMIMCFVVSLVCGMGTLMISASIHWIYSEGALGSSPMREANEWFASMMLSMGLVFLFGAGLVGMWIYAKHRLRRREGLRSDGEWYEVSIWKSIHRVDE
jgi:hypothetical protein